MFPILQMDEPPKPSRSQETFNDSWNLQRPGAVLLYFVCFVLLYSAEDDKKISSLPPKRCKVLYFAVFLCWQRDIIKDNWHISLISEKLFTCLSRVSCEIYPSPQINVAAAQPLLSV